MNEYINRVVFQVHGNHNGARPATNRVLTIVCFHELSGGLVYLKFNKHTIADMMQLDATNQVNINILICFLHQFFYFLKTSLGSTE